MAGPPPAPQRVINSVAPIRICDCGGWTDTWFARRGRVLSIAVSPCVEVQIQVWPRAAGRERFTIYAENYEERYSIGEPRGCYDRHPLIEAAMEYAAVPEDLAIEVSIYSEAPPGCSTGTSAAVGVALLGALDCLTPGRLTPHQAAMAAFHVETRMLKQQCGIQDQIGSAYGGINFIEMTEYPECVVSRLSVPDALRWELEARLVLIYLGRSHSSSDVHRMVIRRLEESGMDAPELERLRRCAAGARDALAGCDLEAFGRVMVENTDAQADLHPELVGPHHRRVIEIAREFGAAGWKVNGAGGDGGSVTLMGPPDSSRRRQMIRAICSENPLFRHIPILLAARGLRIWEAGGKAARA
jgi:D-glycero-alpha-D-manno-heptose-7-phosphate kinase